MSDVSQYVYIVFCSMQFVFLLGLTLIMSVDLFFLISFYVSFFSNLFQYVYMYDFIILCQ